MHIPIPPLARLVGVAIAFAGAAAGAGASCGSAFCSLMTDRYAQGGTAAPGSWSSDLRLELVTQDRLREGSRTIDPSQVTGVDAIERRTVNHNLVESLSYAFDEGWSIGIRVPLVQRRHEHDLLADDGSIGPHETWDFTRLGDVQLLARRQLAGHDAALSWALFGGLLLPTGATTVANADGSRAERALQPGSGATAVVAGAAARFAAGPLDRVFGQAGVTTAVHTKDDFRPGRRTELSIGWSHAWTAAAGSVLQLNWRHRARDAGSAAEPDLSGSTTLDLSPGLTLATGPASTVYAFLQLPLKQQVNGIQLVPRHALALGWTRDF